MEEVYYEENYPDCIGEIQDYNKQPGCLTCIYKGDCLKEIKKQDQRTNWEDDH